MTRRKLRLKPGIRAVLEIITGVSVMLLLSIDDFILAWSTAVILLIWIGITALLVMILVKF